MLSATPMSPKRPPPPGRLSFGGKRDRHLTTTTGVDISTPPPPYDNTSSLRQLHDVFGDSETSPVTTLLGQSVVATAQMLGYELPTTDSNREIQNDSVLQQKSRDELADLLKNAEAVIRKHETELNLAALAGEALLRENNHLRSRHDSLLARVKPAQYDSLRAAIRTSGSFEQHLVPSVPPTPASEHPSLPLPPPVTPPRTHKRGMSASPEQIAQLNTQNDELHTRLERIVSDANQTDRESKRKLRQLQKEIEGLRNELDSTHRRNMELENEAAEVRQETKRTREEREEQLVTARIKARRDSNLDEYEPVKDFAPGFPSSSSSRTSLSSLPSSSSNAIVPFPSRAFTSDLEAIPSVAMEEEEDEDADVFGTVRRRSRLTSCTPEEFTLLAQILSKVKELEDANNTISASQKDMREKIDIARREATEMKHRYDGLELEEIEGVDSNGETVRFLSLRGAGPPPKPAFRRLHSTSTGGYEDPGLPDSPMLTTNDNPLLNLSKPRKIRRPINKLFLTSPDDPFSREDTERTIRPSPPRKAPRTPPPSLQSTIHGSIRVTAASPPGPGQDESPAASSAPRPGLLSPSSSFLGLSLPASLSNLMNSAMSAATTPAPRTLEDEIGGDFGEEWASPNPHASIFDESFAAFHAGEMSTSTSAASNLTDEGLGEHPAMAALREALDPANAGRMLEPGEHILPEGSLASAPGEAFALLGRAVVARPNRWVARSDGRPLITAGPPRFKPKSRTLDPEDDPWETTRYPEDDSFYNDERMDDMPPSSATTKWSSQRRNSALGRLGTMARHRRMSTIETREKPGEFVLVDDAEASEPEPKQTVREKVHAKGVEIVLELWLFLQFVVVIGVFVFVMARKGPRAVLGEPAANRRRTM
ncbi:hypothetical protein EXIGLDRAFT_828204 [Exidia glandulosa HHB12029]|uniref:Uncharacterized protein n=1 Tax=Exidia glandulosa HHB12029 TaxID=1314781 RepID=A0A165QZY8_EXIGL|nr:hypothetical protein EXIGLDRAFT_828204 [Exidia glandulosa HHB12029]